ncbi:Xaa-Pro peptidase family protein [Parvularcula sp. LCG005]|uniref:M24 family metallopeptidase n=1 Tax=Parvularcula sp. LCG005 TaxID=3078805 RepID=UPI002941DA54|nr:Xaa-Pro peptidase family protein [Parvularcula sp. LCG005]WOI53421.1 Xaa-Pro peptidase family protein [Parvularcula sp. LCG005]
MLTKRDFLLTTGAGVTALGLRPALAKASSDVVDMSTSVEPISTAERAARVEKAQTLMQQKGIAAIVLEPGPSMLYFTAMRWWRSERLTAVIIPAQGTVGVVTPHFEEPSVRESLDFEPDVRVWNEHESPFQRVAEFLDDCGIPGPVGLERTVRYFVADGLKSALPNREIVPASPIVNGCRLYKSDHEIAIMQVANNITMAAYTEVFSKIETGMTPQTISQMMNEATIARGGKPSFSMALLNEASAYPHGSDQPQTVKEGGIILMDCGCSVHGYESDISRTWVHGEPTKKQKRVWALVRSGQELALEKAQIGTPAGQIDDAVRGLYTRYGFGPDYQLPGLSHRLGHGIGMEGHEPVNFVRGEMTPLARGMCLSNEPGIYIPGEFGVRLEDCLYMTEDGPKLFSGLSKSISDPMSV